MSLPYGARGPRIDRRALRTKRIGAGLTQTALAARVKVGQGYISRMEAGARTHPNPRITVALARALDCTVDDLLITESSGAQHAV